MYYSIRFKTSDSDVWTPLLGLFTERRQADLRAEEIARKFDTEYGLDLVEVKVKVLSVSEYRRVVKALTMIIIMIALTLGE